MRISRHLLLAAFGGIAVLAVGTIASSQTGPSGLRSGLRGNTLCKRRGRRRACCRRRIRTSVRFATIPSSRRSSRTRSRPISSTPTSTSACRAMRARERANSQAPMVSITHFMDRDGQFLASVSPRRYFCIQCHVPQHPGEAAGRQSFRRCGHASERSSEGGKMSLSNDNGAPAYSVQAIRQRARRFGDAVVANVPHGHAQRLLEYWAILTSPSRTLSLGFLTIGGFLAGIVFWGGFNTALEATNTEKFCVSCHEMRENVFQELKSTIHYSNRSGVRATCPDCHVPHNWTHKIGRKIQASKEVWGKIFGSISTREKFLDMRFELASHEWERLKANDSLECRNCHSAESMDISKQSQRAANAHQRSLFTGEKTCIDCHKGIAHRLPKGAYDFGLAQRGIAERRAQGAARLRR